jgi:uncharacterized protein YdeI (YjbR/CyaY-like superfamily)
MNVQPDNNLQVITFALPKDWAQWLEQFHDQSKGIWIRFYKKPSTIASITYDEALDEALCYGWIDGQLKSYDEQSYIRKFTPRRAQSIWSKRNIEHIERLKKECKMKPSGLLAAETAKADGRWARAYDSPSRMEIPDDFLIELSKDTKAFAFFETLNKANKYAIAWRLQTAKKPGTRDKRMTTILQMLANEEKFHN